MDPNLNTLLKWSLANTTPSSSDPTSSTTAPRLSPSALAALLGNTLPSTATLMKTAMATITTPTTPLEAKLTAFDNLEQMIESIDNANDLGPLGLWPPLIAQLDSPDPELRRMAAWCVGTAVQNNDRAREMFLTQNATATLVRLALEDIDAGVRRKAIYALSSAMRNSQPATDEVVRALGPGGGVDGGGGGGRVEAGDMCAVDGVVELLRRGGRTG